MASRAWNVLSMEKARIAVLRASLRFPSETRLSDLAANSRDSASFCCCRARPVARSARNARTSAATRRTART